MADSMLNWPEFGYEDISELAYKRYNDNDHKSGWSDADVDWLLAAAVENLESAEIHSSNGETEKALSQMADAFNYVLFSFEIVGDYHEKDQSDQL